MHFCFTTFPRGWRNGLVYRAFQSVKRHIRKNRRNYPPLCEASNYAKRCAKSVDMRPFSVEFLCIVSDDGFESFSQLSIRRDCLCKNQHFTNCSRIWNRNCCALVTQKAP